jgi:hypothetical protein
MYITITIRHSPIIHIFNGSVAGASFCTILGIPVFVEILPEDGPYRPKHVVMIQVEQ